MGDAAFGAAFGGIAGAPESATFQVWLGGAAGFGNGVAQQMVGNGWHWNQVKPSSNGGRCRAWSRTRRVRSVRVGRGSARGHMGPCYRLCLWRFSHGRVHHCQRSQAGCVLIR
jgi:hypothetical protein